MNTSRDPRGGFSGVRAGFSGFIQRIRRHPDPFLIRPIAGSLIVLLLIGALGLGLWRGGMEVRRWVLTRHAREAVERKDWPEALGFLRQVLERHPRDLTANRLMVAFCREASPRSYFEWLSRLQGLEPDNRQVSLELGNLAVRLQQDEVAEAMARGLWDDPVYGGPAHNIMALVEGRRGNLESALEHFREAHRLKPDSRPILANYAAFLTRYPDPSALKEWEGLLARMSTTEGGSLAVLRLRLARALTRDDGPAALGYSAAILQDPRHEFGDRVRHLGLVRAFRPSEFTGELERLRQAARTRPPDMTAMLDWFVEQRMWREALDWLDEFPPVLQQSTHFRFIRLQCARALPLPPQEIRAWLEGETWGPGEAMRLAGLSEAHARAGDAVRAAALKKDAVTAAGKSAVAAQAFVDLVEHWPGWKGEVVAVLESQTEDPLFGAAALDGLFRIHRLSGDAGRLLPVAERMHRLRPKSPIFRGNHLALALLADPRSPKLLAACESFYYEHPDNPHAAGVFAHALVMQDRADEGVAVLEKVPRPIRLRPPLQLVYGHALARAGRRAEADTVLAGVDASRLLDAERALLKSVQAPPPSRTQASP